MLKKRIPYLAILTTVMASNATISAQNPNVVINKLILAGQNMGLKKDVITDLQQNPSEMREGRIYEEPDRVALLRRTVMRGDSIVPYQKELPFRQGQEGFVAPKEWKITKD